MPRTSWSPSLCQGALCVYWVTSLILSQEINNFALAFTCHLHRHSGSSRDKSLWLSQSSLTVHAQSPGHTPLCACTWPSKFIGMCQSFSRSLWIQYSLSFSFKLLVSLLFILTCSITSSSHKFKQLTQSVLTNTPEENVFPTRWALFWVMSNKDSFASMVSLLGDHQTNQMMAILWEWGFEGGPASFCNLQWLPDCQLSMWLQAIGFQGYHGTREGRWELLS